MFAKVCGCLTPFATSRTCTALSFCEAMPGILSWFSPSILQNKKWCGKQMSVPPSASEGTCPQEIMFWEREAPKWGLQAWKMDFEGLSILNRRSKEDCFISPVALVGLSFASIFQQGDAANETHFQPWESGDGPELGFALGASLSVFFFRQHSLDVWNPNERSNFG